jgi:hypothetical protein
MAERRRWDTDERFVGVADAGRASQDVAALLAMTNEPGWVTEDALEHLGPSCTAAAADLRIEITRMEVVDAVLEIDVRATRDGPARAPRVDAYGVIGGFAEGATYVRESRAGGDVILDVVTGVMPGDNAFATHGHMARIRIVGA